MKPNTTHTPHIFKIGNKTYDFTGRKVFYYQSCIALWIRFNRENYTPSSNNSEKGLRGRKFYMPELEQSLPQILYKNIPPTLNINKSIERAKDLVNNNFKGKFDLARIYFEWFEQDGELIIPKANTLHECKAGEVIETLNNPINLDNKNYIEFQQNRENDLAYNFKKAEVVVDFPNKVKIYQRREYQHPFN